MPKVTIIIPVYNVEEYLAGCLDSAVTQTLKDIEIICVNDGSTDGSRDIISRYMSQDSRIRIIDKGNAGYGAAINDGFDAAQAEYVTILEPDDLFTLRACESMLEFATNNDLDFLKADADWFVADEDHALRKNPASRLSLCYDSVFSSSDDPGRYPSRSGQPGMYRLSFLRDNCIRLHESPGASFQDTGLWAQAMFAGKRVRFLAESCYFIREDNSASSLRNHKKIYCICDEYDFIRRRIDEMENIDRERCAKACSYFRFRGYKWNLSRIPDSSAAGFLERFSSDFRAIHASGELDTSYFSSGELEFLESVMDDPRAVFYEKYRYREYHANLQAQLVELQKYNKGLRLEVDTLECRLDKVYNSRSYRLGHMLSTPAKAVRNFLRKE